MAASRPWRKGRPHHHPGRSRAGRRRPAMEPTKRRKAPSRARVSRRNASRRWCVPPALLHEPEELLEGVGVLDELPTQVGLVLWQSLRDVTLWAQVEPEERADLFEPDAARARLSALLASGAEPAL